MVTPISSFSSPTPPPLHSPSDPILLPQSSPRKSASAVLRAAGYSPKNVHSSLKKELTFSQAIKQQLQATAAHSKEHKDLVISLLSGPVIKKARCCKELSSALGVSIRRVSKNEEILTTIPKKHRLTEEKARVCEVVSKFLELDENSRMNPGKRDYVNVEGQPTQTRILNDYMQVIFDRFVAEFPEEKVGRTSFYEMRPPHILPSSNLESQSCLCQIHENMALLLQSVRAYSTIRFSTNPDVFHKDMVSKDMSVKDFWQSCRVEGVEDTELVPIRQWTRAYDWTDRKLRTKCVQKLIAYSDLIIKGSAMFEKFDGHTERIRAQYSAIKKLKDSLKQNEIVVHMDFAENYSCKGERMIQSSYWNPVQVTLHPVVVYFRNEKTGEVEHRSLVYVSSQNQHNSTMVMAIIKSLMLEDIVDIIKENHITHVNYITDSPSSQYRNRFQAFLVSVHEELFGLTCTWHFFETGHGKCVCDGVGGVVKRSADQASKHGIIISSGVEFFEWASQLTSKMVFKYITKAAYEVSAKDVKGLELALKAIPGTMEIHSMKPDCGKLGSIRFLPISCTCDECRDHNLDACGSVWLSGSCLKTGKALRNAKAKGGSFFTNCSICPILCVCYLKRQEYVSLEGDRHELSTDDDIPLTALRLSNPLRDDENSDPEDGYVGPARQTVEGSVDMVEEDDNDGEQL